MDELTRWLFVSTFFSLVLLSSGVELTFELPDSARECFHEVVDKDVSVTIDFQVVTGGQYDIDVILQAPNQEIIYRQIKSQFDSHTFNAPLSGEYKVCFSNEFSTFSHKLVYMDFQVGDRKTMPGLEEQVTVMTMMETSAQVMRNNMVEVESYQTGHRLREAQGRKRAEDLNERVLWWSVMNTIAILVITVGQVFVLKNFFTERKSF